MSNWTKFMILWLPVAWLLSFISIATSYDNDWLDLNMIKNHAYFCYYAKLAAQISAFSGNSGYLNQIC